MNAQYDIEHDTFLLELTRAEAVDLSVFTAMRSNARWLQLNNLGDLHGKLRWMLDCNPHTDICANPDCKLPIVYAEGEWRHRVNARARCAGGGAKAEPIGQHDDGRFA